MQDVNTRLEHLQQKLQQVLGLFTTIRAENERLHMDVEQLQRSLTAKEEELKEAKYQGDLLKSGIQHWHPAQKKLFTKRIDIYLKEINKCLAELEK